MRMSVSTPVFSAPMVPTWRPVAQDGDAIADREAILQRVGNVDDPDASRRQALDDLEERLLLTGAQGRGGLVHQDDLGVEGHRLGDLEKLHVRETERRDLGVRVDLDPEFGEYLPAAPLHRRLVAHSQPPEQPVRAPQIAAQEEIALDVHQPHEAQLLVDDADAEFARERGGAPLDHAAFELHLAGIFFDDARDDLDHGGLAGPVLAQEHVDLAGANAEIHLVERHDARERLADSAHVENEALRRVFLTGFGRMRGGRRHGRVFQLEDRAARASLLKNPRCSVDSFLFGRNRSPPSFRQSFSTDEEENAGIQGLWFYCFWFFNLPFMNAREENATL